MYNTLEDYYIFLNEDKLFKENISLSNNLKSLQNKLISEVEKKHCTIEICFNEFNFKKGLYVPLFSVGSNCYPDLNSFDDLEYLRHRALNCINSKSKSKYFHLLYHKTNDKRNAITAIEAYLDLLKNFKLDLSDNLEIKGFIDAFDNLIYLVEKVKYDQKDEVIQFVKDTIQENKVKGFCLFHIIDFVTNNMKLKIDINQFFFDVIEAEINAIQYIEHREDFLNLIISLAQKIGKTQQEYQNLLGDYYLEEGKKEVGSFFVNTYYFNALKMYKKAGNKDKLNEVSKLMEDAKSFIGLKKVQTKIDAPEIDEYFKNIDKKTSELIENFSSASIYECLILGENIFPKASMLEEFYKSPIQELVTTITFDSNSNISIGNYKGFNSYQIYFNAISIQYLNQIFLKGQNNSKINYESLKDYFENYTWYSLINNVIKPNSSDCSFKWLDFILPPLELFFEQSEKDIKNGINSKEQYILIIDSLALKFEGVLRDFSNRIGAQIIEANELNTEMRIDFEKLFENEKFKELVPEYDVAFFKYLFTRKGLNIRNNVAHSFYTPNDYSVSIIWLLICAYLKLGNFEFKVNKKDGEQ